MRAAVLVGPGRVETRIVPKPEPGPGQVRIRLEGCGVCASNLGPWAGPDWMRFPTEPGDLGHEGWGIVDAVGEGVRDVLPGQRVGALSYHAFAEYDVAAAEAVAVLPEALRSQPFPAEPLGCAMNIFRRSDIAAGQTVGIVGIGFLGTLLTRLARQAGARVIAISRRGEALERARRMGADEAFALDDDVVSRVEAATDGRLCDRVIEAVGKQTALTIAGAITGTRGRLVIAGYHQDGSRQIDMQLWNWRGLDVINAHEREPAVYLDGMRRAIEAVETGLLDPAPLYTHRYPLERLGEALDATRDRPPGFMKALVMFP